jgi:hypothetical protein
MTALKLRASLGVRKCVEACSTSHDVFFCTETTLIIVNVKAVDVAVNVKAVDVAM